MNVLLAAVSGLLLAVAVPNEIFPMGSPIVGLVALAPYFLAVMRVRRPRGASLAGLAFALTSTLGSNYWLAFFQEFSVWTLGGTTLAYMGMHALLAPFLWRMGHSPSHLRPILLALAWAAYEYLKSIGFLGYPWGLIAYPYNDIPLLIQHVDVTGIWAASVMAALSNGMLAELLRSREGRGGLPSGAAEGRAAGVHLRDGTGSATPAAAAALSPLARVLLLWLLIGALISGYGLFRLARPPRATDTVAMTLIQQNVDSWVRGNEWPSVRQAQELTREALAARSEPPELIAWSETILRRPFPENRSLFERRPEGDPFVEFLRSLPAPLLTGAPAIQSLDPFEPVNAAILLDSQAEQQGFYGKRHLVPMAEHVPFWEFPPVRAFYEGVLGIGALWTPGDRWAVFATPGGADSREGAGLRTSPREAPGPEEMIRFGTPICFEDSFGYLGRELARLDADLLINLTNNSWSRTRSAQIQHFVSARYRAVENRMALVRSTNSGYTAVVDAAGAVMADVPMFEEAYLNVDVPLYAHEGETIYTRFGDYLGRLWVALSVAALLGLHIRDRRRQPTYRGISRRVRPAGRTKKAAP